MPRLVTVLCRMTTVNLQNSILVDIFAEYGLSLETLGIDFLNIFKNQATSTLFLDSMVFDIVEMIECTNMDVDKEEALQDLRTFILEISKHLSYIHIVNSRLRNIQFQGIDTLILEFTKL